MFLNVLCNYIYLQLLIFFIYLFIFIFCSLTLVNKKYMKMYIQNTTYCSVNALTIERNQIKLMALQEYLKTVIYYIYFSIYL